MVEFGAGGQITQPQQPALPPPAVVVDSNPQSNPDPPDPPLQTPTTPATTNVRRKRKAKGWFCPVCRQRMCLFLQYCILDASLYIIAYTSLLRITTAPPPPLPPPQEGQVAVEKEQQESNETPQASSSAHPTTEQNTESNERSGGGLLGAALNIRPGFLRGLASSLRNTSAVIVTDVESRAGLERVGA